MYLINEVSRKVELSQKRIREYEKEGFILPEREANTNNRLYSDFEVSQIRRINFLIHERGFTLACLRNLMVLAPCWNIFACPQKESCAAYQEPHRPCWEIRGQASTLCPGPCERCAVYLNREYAAQRVLEPSGGAPMDQQS
ncbi:MAG: MerR family transcriptional regulator [Deltaproteobacteria bacterium]|nr:MerR family transcriptional regulator [Deltaproteobacteria bacterium]